MYENTYLNSKRKRLLDIIGALFGLIIGLPFFIVASIIIFSVDQVNPFFVQQRLGLGGVGFSFMKLRTLQVVENPDMLSAEIVSDKMTYSYTKTGKFWRKTSIDEVFQFWYILKGSMSLIGYRPIPVDYVDYLSQLKGVGESRAAYYLNAISKVKPGLSSLSSVNGRTNLKMKDKMDMDLVYLKEASFKYDLKLLVKSVFYVIVQKDT